MTAFHGTPADLLEAQAGPRDDLILYDVGQVVEDKHRIPTADAASAGSYRIAVGMYELDSLERLEAVDAESNALPEGQIVLGTRVEVESP